MRHSLEVKLPLTAWSLNAWFMDQVKTTIHNHIDSNPIANSSPLPKLSFALECKFIFIFIFIFILKNIKILKIILFYIFIYVIVFHE
jgi:hypothetical protein